MKRIEHLVLLHGWGGDSRCWKPLIEALAEKISLPVVTIDLPGFGRAEDENWAEDEILLASLFERLPQNCVLIGHSLGGMLAAKLAAHHEEGQEQGRAPEKIRGLITIGANARFVAADNWPGMNQLTFAQFRQSFAVDPAATWEKFCGLQARGDSEARRVIKQLRQWRPENFSSAYTQSLDCLGRWDNREILRNPPVPALHLFGERDTLVPVAAAELIGERTQVLAGCGHAPHVSSPALVAEKISEFIGRACGPHAELELRAPGESPFSKSAVARSFGRAAQSYDSAAHLQRAVCRQLLHTLENDWVPRRILDLGSGTGYGSALLRLRFPRAEIIALDLAGEMLGFARARRPVADFYIVADAERLPLAEQSIDLVFSSMALQWCYQLPRLFAEIQRVLSAGGRALVSTLGPGTLRELKASWAKVDSAVHINRFLSQDQWREAAEHCGLAASARTEERVLHFDSALQLMRELKSIGAHNINRDAERGLLSREKLRRLSAAYEGLRTDAGLPANYQVIYLDLARSAEAGSVVSGNCRDNPCDRPNGRARGPQAELGLSAPSLTDISQSAY